VEEGFLDLKGKVAIVTGAGGGGQGRALASRLAREGVSVLVSDIDRNGGEQTVAMIQSAGGTAVFVPANVEREDEIVNLISQAEMQFGGLDIMVNNAGPFVPGAPLEAWPSLIHANLMGSIYGTVHAMEPMRRRGGGVIIYYGSTSAIGHGRKHASVAAYDVAKAAIARLATTTAWMRDAFNIRTNCVIPDWVATDEIRTYWESVAPDQRRDHGIPDTLTDLEEISSAVLRLITDDSLYGRLLVWWSGKPPGLVPVGDPGYTSLEPFEIE
jgi:NAD(P)-dependent dehydrogenase (short-subunit alcohol dehydrogenase family)